MQNGNGRRRCWVSLNSCALPPPCPTVAETRQRISSLVYKFVFTGQLAQQNEKGAVPQILSMRSSFLSYRNRRT